MLIPLTVYSNSSLQPISVRNSIIDGEQLMSKHERTNVGLFVSPNSGFPTYLNCQGI